MLSWSRSDSARACAIGPTSCRAVSSSASPSRALATAPDLVFADEPTGNLDSRSSREVLALLAAASSEHGQSIAMVTHDPVAARHADRVIFLADGRIVADERRMSAEEISSFMLAEEARA